MKVGGRLRRRKFERVLDPKTLTAVTLIPLTEHLKITNFSCCCSAFCEIRTDGAIVGTCDERSASKIGTAIRQLRGGFPPGHNRSHRTAVTKPYPASLRVSATPPPDDGVARPPKGNMRRLFKLSPWRERERQEFEAYDVSTSQSLMSS